MFINPRKESYATYEEVLDAVLRDMGTATPHIQALKLIAYLFDTNVGVVKQDCQERFLRLRELDRRHTPRS